MACMFPAACSSSTRSMGEKEVFQKLRTSLDDSWRVFHSYDALGRNREGRLIDAEIDFLLFHPTHGILVLEVKSGVIRRNNKGEWFQNDKYISSPAKQARLNKYTIKDYLSDSLKLSQRIPVVFGHAVCFPDCFSDMDGLPADTCDIAISGAQIPYLEEEIIRILTSFGKGLDCNPDPGMVKALTHKLMPVFEYGAGVVDRIGQEERTIFNLTEEQCKFLDFINKHKKAIINGCAGSGKTIMAVKKAQRLAVEGRSVLLLCYNKVLANKLKQTLADTNGDITVSNYHKFCLTHLEQAGYDANPDGKPETFWSEDVPEMFLDYTDKHTLQYDAVIIDEGQDFKENYWYGIMNLLTADSFFYIFYDSDQNLFESKLNFPDFTGNEFVLEHNCRNTRMIFSRMKPFAHMDIRIADKAPRGTDVYEWYAPEELERRKELSRVLHELVREKGLDEDQIVILGGHSMEHTCIGDDPEVGMFTIVQNGDPGPNRIPYYTYMKFKGCESDAVVLLDVDRQDNRWSRDRALYTAMSRATHLLYIIGVGGGE